ncbi:MAG: serine hydrolase [Acidobacteria bacterium]|nr:serine hydrolase [Acidobacteriota bacterium]
MQPNAAASMVTTANDYARFVAAAMKNAELRKPHVTMRTGKDWMLGWGLGWGIERTGGREYLWQWGDNSGYKNVVFGEPASGSGVFVFTNGDAGQAIYDRVVRHVTRHDHPALLWI